MTVLHVDMDAFFASVEQRDHPQWRGKPVIVGAGPRERGVVSTCSYEARRFGVRSAMPSRTAFSLCPQGIFVRPRMQAYQQASDVAFGVFSHYSPFVEAVSVDEAFLDITGSVHLFGGARELGERLRAEIRERCGVTCSVGIASNRLLAKIASEQNKPDGIFEMPLESAAIREFLAPRPVGILWGVGKKTAETLTRYGFRTCGDLQRADARFLSRLLGESAAESIRMHALGVDHSPVAWEGAAEKSVSREHTFAHDERDRETVRSALLDLVADVARRFRTESRRALTGKLKLRDGAFNTITRQATFPAPARDDISFRRLAIGLFDREWPENAGRSVRLIGFGVSNFTDAAPVPVQGDLFGGAPDAAAMAKRERLSAALDAIGAAGKPAAFGHGSSIVL
jgi:nucleotidyltransferase/DNA polymerase involved in DNA repair